jgi:hypothetical protein
MNYTIQKKLVTTVSTLLVLVFVCAPFDLSAAYKIDTIDVANTYLNDFVVGPSKTELEIKPGESKTAIITVSNRMGGTRTFSLSVEDFTGSKNPMETVVFLGDERGPYSLRDFIHFEQATFDLKHGERASIPVRVTLPTDVQPGGRYGSVLVSTTAKESVPGQRSAIVTRLGALFFVKVPGEVEEDGKLVGFETKGGQSLFGHGPIDFDILYENNGSVYLNPYGEIRIRNIVGQEVGAVQVEPWFAMPQSLRLRQKDWDRSFLFGRYTATASINRGYGDIVDTMTVSFWVIPWKVLLAVFVGVAVFIWLVRFMFKKFEIKRK